MGLSTTEAVRELFNEATRSDILKHMKHEHEWDRFKAIRDEAKERVTQEKDDFKQNYDQRLDEARQIILREASGNVLDPPKPDWANTSLTKEGLDAQADARIRQDHERRLASIKQDETDQYQDLRQSIINRDALDGFAEQSFEQVRRNDGPTRT